jgi:hypothetical protein
MCAPLISFETVREIMTSWMTQYTEEWDNEGRRWRYESNTHDFSWYKYSKGLFVGASLSDEGTVITIWTGTCDNDNIIVSKDGIIFNDHSDFDQGFEHGPIYWLYTKLKSHALSNSAKLEPIEDEVEDEIADEPTTETPKGLMVRMKFDLGYFELYKAYAVYDQGGECKHAVLRNATENKLEFIYYYKAGPTHISVSIDDYLNKKFKIKPLVDDEQ